MKRLRSIVIVCFISFLYACNGNMQQEYSIKIDSLQSVINERTSQYDELTSYLNLVASGLDSINSMENIIYLGKDEVTGKKLTRKEIRQRIDDLKELVIRQRTRIEELSDSLSFITDKKVAALQTIIANLNAQLEEKERTIQQLKGELNSSKTTITNLQANVSKLNQEKGALEEHVSMQEEALERQNDMINEGYYIIGTRKELKAAGVISANLLQKSKVNLETADLSKLQKIDIRTFSNEMKINAKKAVILSHMPEASYSMVQENGQVILYIKDAALFWSLSKILVIQIK
ncbi:MAG: hypothetical protein IJD32_07495 [Bacteroidaceae bacterium]|nr:hypothetical protein [Bacteroidaceae bacterium]